MLLISLGKLCTNFMPILPDYSLISLSTISALDKPLGHLEINIRIALLSMRNIYYIRNGKPSTRIHICVMCKYIVFYFFYYVMPTQEQNGAINREPIIRATRCHFSSVANLSRSMWKKNRD